MLEHNALKKTEKHTSTLTSSTKVADKAEARAPRTRQDPTHLRPMALILCTKLTFALLSYIPADTANLLLKMFQLRGPGRGLSHRSPQKPKEAHLVDGDVFVVESVGVAEVDADIGAPVFKLFLKCHDGYTALPSV